MIESFTVFKSLADSFQLELPANLGGWQCHRLRDVEQEMLPGGASRKQDQVLLWYRHEPGKPSFRSFLEKLGKWLTSESHPTSPRMINALIEMIVGLMREGKSLVEVIQSLRDRRKTADVSHFAFLPVQRQEKEAGGYLDFEDFTFGNLDLTSLKHRCQKAGTDFFDHYGEALKGRPAISSPIYKRVIFDMVSTLHKVPNLTWDSPVYQMILRYFEALAAEHFEMTWSDLSEKKLMIEAFGYSIVDEEILRHLPGLWKVTIYLNFGHPDHNAGYVVPNISTKIVGLPHLGEMQTAIDSLNQAYRFSELRESPLNLLLKSVCQSIVTSRRFRAEQKPNEAYLHQVIALEQVFSEKEKTTQAVGGRTAVLVHRQLGLSYSEAKKLIIKLYDARSLFVHRGQKVPPELFDQIEPVALAVVKSLIHLCHQPNPNSDEFLADWLKRLDFIIAGFDAGIPPTSEMALANGLIEPDDVFLP